MDNAMTDPLFDLSIVILLWCAFSLVLGVGGYVMERYERQASRPQDRAFDPDGGHDR